VSPIAEVELQQMEPYILVYTRIDPSEITMKVPQVPAKKPSTFQQFGQGPPAKRPMMGPIFSSASLI